MAMLTEHLTEKDVMDLVARYLNEVRPDEGTLTHIRLLLKLNVLPLLAWIFEQGPGKEVIKGGDK